LRSPGQFTEQGFRAFNESYVVTLRKWGVFDGKVNPVARSNVCPEIEAPAEPSFHAFSFTMPAAVGTPSFVISGRAEAREGDASYRERIVRFGEAGDDAMRENARYVMDEVAARLALLGVGWREVTATQVYTIRDITPSWRTRSSAAARHAPASPGITPGRRFAISNSNSTAAACGSRRSFNGEAFRRSFRGGAKGTHRTRNPDGLARLYHGTGVRVRAKTRAPE
jgi:hypothetical protein